MKNSTYNIVYWTVIIALLPVFYTVFGQGDFRNSTPEQRAKQQTEWMKAQLNLDSTLTQSVYDVNLKYARKNQVIMSSDGERSEKMKQMRANNDAKDEELKKILTKEQFTLYQQKQEEMRQQRRERRQQRENN